MKSNMMYINRLSIKQYEGELVIKRKRINLKKALISGVTFVYFLMLFRSIFSVHILSEEHYFLVVIYMVSAVILSYLIVNGWLNGTRIVVDRELLEIGEWPISILGNWKIPASEITSLYIRNNIDLKSENKDVAYDIHALTLWGRDMKIIGGIGSSVQARKIKEDISNFLDLAEIPSSKNTLHTYQFAN